MAQSKRISKTKRSAPESGYTGLLASVSELLEQARKQSARSVNAILTATYWEVGRRIVEYEQRGEQRAEYGEALLKKLAADLSARFGRGYSRQNIQQMRQFYIAYNTEKICQTLSGKSNSIDMNGIFQTSSGISSTLPVKLETDDICQTPSGISEKSETLSWKFSLVDLVHAFPLSWSHYVHLLSVVTIDMRTKK
jgi:DUF1016 N-terminal domain